MEYSNLLQICNADISTFLSVKYFKGCYRLCIKRDISDTFALAIQSQVLLLSRVQCDII